MPGGFTLAVLYKKFPFSFVGISILGSPISKDIVDSRILRQHKTWLSDTKTVHMWARAEEHPWGHG